MTNFFKAKWDKWGFLWNYVCIIATVIVIVIISWGRFFKLYIPRRVSLFNENDLIATHALGNIMIGGSSILISALLFRFIVKGNKFSSKYIYFLFSLFLMLVGVLVVMESVAIWVNISWLNATVKVVSGIVGIFILINFPEARKMMERLQEFNGVKEFKEEREHLHRIKNELYRTILEKNELKGGLLTKEEIMNIMVDKPKKDEQ